MGKKWQDYFTAKEREEFKNMVFEDEDDDGYGEPELHDVRVIITFGVSEDFTTFEGRSREESLSAIIDAQLKRLQDIFDGHGVFYFYGHDICKEDIKWMNE